MPLCRVGVYRVFGVSESPLAEAGSQAKYAQRCSSGQSTRSITATVDGTSSLEAPR